MGAERGVNSLTPPQFARRAPFTSELLAWNGRNIMSAIPLPGKDACSPAAAVSTKPFSPFGAAAWQWMWGSGCRPDQPK